MQCEDSGTDDNNNDIVSNYDNFVASGGYDKTITSASASSFQSRQYRKNLKKEEDEEIQKTKLIMVVDDDPDTPLAFKKVLEAENYKSTNSSIFFEVYIYNHPELALAEFKPNFYNLLLIDINMPGTNGFELAAKVLEIDANPKICFMSSAEVNHEALREVYPAVNIGCFIKKPVTVEHLVRRVKSELE